MPLAPALIQGGLGLGQLVTGLINSEKTKDIAEELERTRPKYSISPEVGKTLSLTESELAGGMSALAEKAYNDANDRALSTSLSAILKGGGDVNNVGDIYDRSQAGRLKLATLQEDLRLKQIQSVIEARKNKQQEEQTMWQVNQFAPWQDKAQANGQARIASQGQVWEGLNTIGSAGMQYGQQRREQKMFDDYFNPPQPTLSTRPEVLTASVERIPAEPMQGGVMMPNRVPVIPYTFGSNNVPYNNNGGNFWRQF